MSLSEAFPEDFRADFAKQKLKIGSVIRVFVQDTNPPKEKRFILIGQSYDKLMFASIYINSEINPNVFHSAELRSLNVELIAADREYLDHDSYADCSMIFKRNADWLLHLIKSDPSKIIGELSAEDLKEISSRIKSARTITVAEKKTFGLFL
ncbi:hypothetical protein [Pedobacter endophyticus]|uniref:Uncharacterized protein n=1 Tax=Pedobacter endophyticus TaxID=2789740 RepID=A0A7S9L335_9SPHI|nr:hypothetical protein [Pedobacter endophyticus]QPH41604.1 hypothetical protein IZT61_10265 [Pedobacter endophyticus]